MKKCLFLMLGGVLLLSGCDELTPEQRRKAMHLPPVGFKGVAETGKVLFAQYCIACHGVSGQGTKLGPPLVDTIYRSSHHADMSFHLAIRDGVRAHHWAFGDMKPLDSVTPEEAEHIIAYIRLEQRRAGIQ